MQDKEILYSMLEREIGNLTAGVPLISSFSDFITSYVIKLIDPYVSAFMDGPRLNTEQLGEFTKEKVNREIEAFKAKYGKEKTEDENETNI